MWPASSRLTLTSGMPVSGTKAGGFCRKVTSTSGALGSCPAMKPRRAMLPSVHSNDVIHSFWVPSLGGKTDMIPGRVNRMVIQADRPGIYRGQCAEYCGLQHALMAFDVIALPRAEFDAWLDRLAQPAREPPAP